MTFDEILDQVLEMLQRRRRRAARAHISLVHRGL
jgi:hypothetical protein